MSTEDQDYKVITTPASKVEVKIRNYVTGADEEAIMLLYTQASKTIVEGSGKDSKQHTEIDTSVEINVNRCKIERFVVAVAGKTENTTGTVFEMRSKDFKAVLDAVNEITKDITLGDTEKKT